MDTNATTTTTNETPAAEAPKAKATKAKKQKNKAPAANAPQKDANPHAEAKAKLLAFVNQAVKDANGKSPNEALVILRAALVAVHSSVPDVELSSNKEQRAAQLKQLRETRANMGWQQCARILGDAIAAVPGAEQAKRFSARQLVSGALVATETTRTTLKGSKSHRGVSIR